MKIQPLLFISAILLMGLGILTLFAPDEIAGLLSRPGQRTSSVAVQLLAGALFSLGILAALYARLFFGSPRGGTT
ncbi:MAG: hypothetical protein AAB011_02445 [Candidatus Eisenbacteria bacterium]